MILVQAPVFNVQLLLDGLFIGATFALAAYGLALVWGVMNVKNLAQGDFAALVAQADALMVCTNHSHYQEQGLAALAAGGETWVADVWNVCFASYAISRLTLGLYALTSPDALLSAATSPATGGGVSAVWRGTGRRAITSSRTRTVSTRSRMIRARSIPTSVCAGWSR